MIVYPLAGNSAKTRPRVCGANCVPTPVPTGVNCPRCQRCQPHTIRGWHHTVYTPPVGTSVGTFRPGLLGTSHDLVGVLLVILKKRARGARNFNDRTTY
jgi:hypothetical protein